MKTKFKITGKIISVILTICMIVSLFAGLELSPMTASAITATKMIHVDSDGKSKIS